MRRVCSQVFVKTLLLLRLPCRPLKVHKIKMLLYTCWHYALLLLSSSPIRGIQQCCDSSVRLSVCPLPSSTKRYILKTTDKTLIGSPMLKVEPTDQRGHMVTKLGRNKWGRIVSLPSGWHFVSSVLNRFNSHYNGDENNLIMTKHYATELM